MRMVDSEKKQPPVYCKRARNTVEEDLWWGTGRGMLMRDSDYKLGDWDNNISRHFPLH